MDVCINPAAPRAAGAGFIDWRLGRLPASAGARRYVLARFDADRFTPGLFGVHGVALPAPIANSVAKRQAEYLGGRICAQAALRMLGVAAPHVPSGPHREPLWPSGYLGSITHNRVYAAALACPQAGLAGVGIDIETRLDEAARRAMTGVVMTDAEAAALRGDVPALGEDGLWTLVFSAKESFFKAAFRQVGAYFDFSAVAVSRIDVAAGLVWLQCRQTLSPDLRAGRACRAQFVFLDADTVMTAVVLGAPDAP